MPGNGNIDSRQVPSKMIELCRTSLFPCLSRRDFLLAASAGLWGHTLKADDLKSQSIDSRALVTKETDAAIKRGLVWLTDRQQPDGSFGRRASFNRYGHNPAVNALCGLALLSSGSTPGRGPYGTAIDRSIEFLLSCAAPTGFIAEDDTSYYEAPMYGHGFATMFLAEVYGMTRHDAIRDVLKRAVQLIIDTQNRQGGWRYAPVPNEADISVTVCQAMALRAAHNTGIAIPKETIERLVQYIIRCQNPDGGFKYQLLTGSESLFPRSAAALVALYTSGLRNEKAIAAGLNYMLQFRPGQPGVQERGYYYYAHYYAVQAAWHAGGDVWQGWYPAIRDELLRIQLPSGNWADQGVSSEYATAMALIILQIPNNFLPIFQR